jgi:hypothetical protein
MVKRRIAADIRPKQAESEGDCDVVVDLERTTSPNAVSRGGVNEKSGHIQLAFQDLQQRFMRDMSA